MHQSHPHILDNWVDHGHTSRQICQMPNNHGLTIDMQHVSWIDISYDCHMHLPLPQFFQLFHQRMQKYIHLLLWLLRTQIHKSKEYTLPSDIYWEADCRASRKLASKSTQYYLSCKIENHPSINQDGHSWGPLQILDQNGLEPVKPQHL
jgi:hypothetical protein